MSRCPLNPGIVIKKEAERETSNKKSLLNLARLSQTLAGSFDDLSGFERMKLMLIGVGVTGLLALAVLTDHGSQSSTQPLYLNNTSPTGQLNNSFPDLGSVLQKEPKLNLTVAAYITLADKLLRTSGLNMTDSSFEKQMNKLGYEVGPIVSFGPQIKHLRAGEENLLPRRFPAADTRLPYSNIITNIAPVTKGEEFDIYATVEVRNFQTGNIEYFGLTGPWRVTPLMPGQTSAPNIVGGKQYEPTWLLLGTRHANGQLESYLSLFTPLKDVVGKSAVFN